MNFRESINNLIRTDKPESTSRALALWCGINVPGWVWYALIYDKVSALVVVLPIVLTFITTVLAIKQYNERKGADNGQPDNSTAPQ